jgi:predicted transcriptional regulator of viral defense system
MHYTIENNILKKMKQNRRGKIFFTNDFAALGKYKACSKALERLAKEGEIMRVSRGIYTIPQKSELLGTLTPSFDSVVAAIVKRDKAKIIPSGLFAENALGLSTQVPMKAVYLTD